MLGSVMFPVNQNRALQGCLLCVFALSCYGRAVFAFSLVVCNVSHCLLWAGSGPCVVHGPVWGCVDLRLRETRNLPEMQLY